jgi:1-acyl-sn-glycerol-3-phosphate acyltransferase
MAEDELPAPPPPPSREELKIALRALAPWRALTRPHVVGIEHVPDHGRVLLVGNHTIYGLLDVPLLMRELFVARDLVVRALSDRAHFKVPFWGDLLGRLGAVEGSRQTCAALMREGEPILVFPGGGREVAKRKGEAYQLLWQARLGFARLAYEHNYAIVPLASVGAEESYDIVLDADDRVMAPIRGLVKRATGRDDIILPLSRGVAITPLPKPQRFYFGFAPPIDPVAWAGPRRGEAAWRVIRDETRSEIERLITELEAIRSGDPQRALLPRIAGTAADAAGQLGKLFDR